MSESIFQVQINSQNDVEKAKDLMNTYMLWHLRMGHLGAQNLQRLPKLVTGMEDIDLTPPIPNVCEGCMYGRQCRQPFSDSTTERELMELVHSDIMGPIRVPSLKNSKYVLTFIEHKSRYPKCFYLDSKEGSNVLEKFKEYKAWAENVTDCQIKILRTDGGGEYVNKAFDIFLKECGIEHQKTVPYTPQQNGIAERFNRTVMEKTRSIIYSIYLPLKL